MMMMKNLIQSLLLIVVLVSIDAQEVIYAKVGEPVTLMSTFPQDQYVYWYFERVDGVQLAWINPFGGKQFSDDENWKSRLSLNGVSLVIKDFQQEFFGTFICSMKSNSITKTTQYKVVQVKVDVKPESILLSDDLLSLTCNVENTRVQNKPRIYWLNPQGEKEGNDEGKVSVSAKSKHNGKWSCVVKDKNVEKVFHMSVTVVGFTHVSLHQYTSPNASLTIPCSINSGVTWEQILEKELKEVQWHFVPNPSSGQNQKRLFYFDLVKMSLTAGQNEGLKLVSPQQKENLSLTRSKAKVEDRGRYTCSMKFKNGRTLNSTIDVDVLEITAHPRTELIYGQEVNLSCSTGDQLPGGMTLNWSHPLDTSFRYLRPPTHITIQEVRKEDSGKWSCELWRDGVKLTSAVILLKTEPRLSVWMLVIICSAAVILLLLLVLVFIHYRRRQQRMRVLRHRLCQCKNPKPKGFYRT